MCVHFHIWMSFSLFASLIESVSHALCACTDYICVPFICAYTVCVCFLMSVRLSAVVYARSLKCAEGDCLSPRICQSFCRDRQGSKWGEMGVRMQGVSC